MLGNEHGGMNEALANLYALTGEMKYLDLARSSIIRRSSTHWSTASRAWRGCTATRRSRR